METRHHDISTVERRLLIMKELHEHGVTTVSRLSDLYGVSEVTIRKDLSVLEEQGRLVRTHGGAILQDHYLYDLPRETKANERAEFKDAIGRAAADLVGQIDTVLLGAGSTTLAVARHLRMKRRLTVATNSIEIANELVNTLEIELMMMGGQVNHATSSVIGAQAEKFLENLAFGWLFLGTDGYDMEHGMTTTNLNEARLNRRMIDVAQHVVLVADSTKFGRRGLSLVGTCDVISTVVTDDGLEARFRDHFHQAGIDVIIASVT